MLTQLNERSQAMFKPVLSMRQFSTLRLDTFNSYRHKIERFMQGCL
jgi:hypothetical protein